MQCGDVGHDCGILYHQRHGIRIVKWISEGHAKIRTSVMIVVVTSHIVGVRCFGPRKIV